MDLKGSTAGSFSSGVPSEMVKDVRSLLVFQLGSCAYALDIHQVKQIIPMMKLTTLPKIEPVFEGIANIHGQFVPVVNTRRCLGMAEMQTDLYTPIILTESGEQVIGLIVDQVSGVASLRGEQVVHPEKILPEGVKPPDILVGVAYLSGQMVMVIDPRLLLDESQVQSLLEALQALCGSAQAEADLPGKRTEIPLASGGPEKKKLPHELNGLREPLARELADLAEACPPAGTQDIPAEAEDASEA